MATQNTPENNEESRTPSDTVSTPPEKEPKAGRSFWRGCRKFTRVLLVIAIILAALTITLVALFMPHQYQAQAAIQIKTVVSSFLFPDEMSDRPMPNYEAFVNTQADLITSQIVLGEVANLLQKENLSIFAPAPRGTGTLLKEVWRRRDLSLLFREDMSPEDRLRQLISSGQLTAIPKQGSELIIISMKHSSEKEATLIVDAFVKAYQIKIVDKLEQSGSRKLYDLEKERDHLCGDVTTAQEEVLKLASKYGTRDLARRQEQMYEQMSDMNRQMAKMRDERITLESQVRDLEQTGTVSDAVATTQLQQDKILRQKQYLNADPLYQNLTQSLIQGQEQQMKTIQKLAPNNPEMLQIEERIKNIEAKLDTRRMELMAELGEMAPNAAHGSATAQDQLNLIRVEKLAAAKQALEKHKNDITLFENEYKSLNTQGNTIGQDQLKMLSLEDKLALNKGIYDILCQRIEQLKIEQNRPGRIEIAYNATSSELPGSKGWIIFWLSCGSVMGVITIIMLRPR